MVLRYGFCRMLLLVSAPEAAAELVWKGVPNLVARAQYAVDA